MLDDASQTENAPHIAQLQAAWPLPAPVTLRPVLHGINNRSWYVIAGDAAYVLRVYHRLSDPARIAREHAVLRALGAFALSFRVPVPLPSRGGETVATLSFDGRDAVAALFPLIAGRHPERGDLDATRAAGVALSELDAAMARLVLPVALAGTPAPDTLLDDIHPAVLDVRALPARLGLDADHRSRLARILASVAETAPGLYRSLPCQWIHADFGAVNLLMDGNAVTGVLDFEFTHVDLRAMDAAWALNFFAFNAEKRADLTLLDAFGVGYTRHVGLTEAERRALPLLIQLNRSLVAVHWCGRHFEGAAAREMAVGNIETLLKQATWLDEHGDHIVGRTLRWRAEGETAGVAH